MNAEYKPERMGKAQLLRTGSSFPTPHSWSSPTHPAAILTIDGVGEWATTTIGVGKDREIRLLKELRFPHSLGLLYSAFTDYCGFRINSGEYKLMGLAPYGEPRFTPTQSTANLSI